MDRILSLWHSGQNRIFFAIVFLKYKIIICFQLVEIAQHKKIRNKIIYSLLVFKEKKRKDPLRHLFVIIN